jgi:hypothetical protein
LGGVAAGFLAGAFAVVEVVFFAGAGAVAGAGVAAVKADAVTSARALQATTIAARTQGARNLDFGWTAGFDRYGWGVRIWIIPWMGRRVGDAA